MLITMSVSGLSDNIRSLDPEERRYLLWSYPWIRGLRSWKTCWWRQGRERPWCQCPGWWRTWWSETWWRGSRTSVRKEQRVGKCHEAWNWCRDSRTSMWDWCCGTGVECKGWYGLGFTFQMVPIPEKPGLFPTRSVRRWRDSAYAVSALPGLLPAWVQLCWDGWLVLVPSDQCSNFYTLASGVQRHSAYNRNPSSSDFACAKAAGSSHSPEGSPRSARKHFTVNEKPWPWHFPS